MSECKRINEFILFWRMTRAHSFGETAMPSTHLGA